MFSIDVLRVITEEREREIQGELRRRGLLGPSSGRIRWYHRPARPRPKER